MNRKQISSIKKTLDQFEAAHGQEKVKDLKKQLATEQAKVDALAGVQNKVAIKKSESNTLKFALLGDIHVGSLYFRPEALQAFYDYAEKQGVQDFFITGDVLSGHRVFKGHEFELRDVGLEAQVDRLKECAPRNGFSRFITGNHDASFKNLVGVSVGKMIEHTVDTWEFLGEEQGRVRWETPEGNFELMLIHPGGGSSYALCFDDTTEVMTEKHGWVQFNYLKKDDRVATRNPTTGAFEWQLPTAYINEKYRGEMLHFRARSFDLLVTPNHRMFVRRYNTAVDYSRKEVKALTHPKKSHQRISKDWKFVEAAELRNAKRQEWQMTKCTEGWVGTTPETVVIPHRNPKKYASTQVKHLGPLAVEDAAELLAWYATEGSIDKKGKQVNICQSQRVNPLLHARIVDLLKRIGFTKVNPRGKDNKDIVVCSVELCDWLKDQCGRGSANMHLPLWLKQCDTEILQLVFDTMIDGDGWVNGRSFAYRSISKQLRADIAEIAVKLGYGVTEFNECVSISLVQKYPTINEKPVSIQYDGTVHCVTVPNSCVLVRRNGRAVFSGNSYRPQKIVESLEGGTKPNMLAIGHYHKAEMMPSYRNVCSVQTGTFEAQTPFMARQGLAAHVGGWLMEVVVGKGYNTIKGEFVAFYNV